MEFFNILMPLSNDVVKADKLVTLMQLLVSQAKKNKLFVKPYILSSFLDISSDKLEEILLNCQKEGYFSVFYPMKCNHCHDDIDTIVFEERAISEYSQECPHCGRDSLLEFEFGRATYKLTQKFIDEANRETTILTSDSTEHIEKETNFSKEFAKELDQSSNIDSENFIKNFLNKLIVGISYDSNGYGTGVLTSKHGLVVSCFHNFFKKDGEKRGIKKIYIKNKGAWYDFSFSNNHAQVIKKEDLYKYFEVDLFAFRIYNSNLNLEKGVHAIRSELRRDDTVWIAAFDNSIEDSKSNKIHIEKRKIIAVEPATADHPNRIKLSAHGFRGWSGSGIFTSDCKLCGILNYIDKEKLDRPLCSVLSTEIVHFITEEMS